MGFVTMKEINSRKRRLRLRILTVSVYWVGPTANRFRVLWSEPLRNVNESQNNTHMHDTVIEYITNLMIQTKELFLKMQDVKKRLEHTYKPRQFPKE